MVSQRVIRAIGLHPKVAQLKGKRVVLIGGDISTEHWLKERGVEVATTLPQGDIAEDVVMITDSQKLTDAERARANALLDYVKMGGRLALLDPPKWTWDKVVDYRTSPGRSSRAFAYPGVNHYLLDGIAPEFLQRWNGIPNVIGERPMQTITAAGARNLLWIEDSSKPVVTSLPTGKGEVLICLLKLRERLLKSSLNYDPAAERMMINLLTP